MTRTLDTFLQQEAQKKDKVAELTQKITDAKATLSQTRLDYEAAVIDDNDKETNRLFQQIEKYENQIRADQHRLQTLKTVTDRHLRESAIETLRTFPSEVRAKHKTQAAKAIEQIEQARAKYIQSLNVLDGLNESYNAERNEYKPLLNRYGLDRRDIDESNSLYSHIDNVGNIAPRKTDMIVTYDHIQKGLEQL